MSELQASVRIEAIDGWWWKFRVVVYAGGFEEVGFTHSRAAARRWAIRAARRLIRLATPPVVVDEFHLTD